MGNNCSYEEPFAVQVQGSHMRMPLQPGGYPFQGQQMSSLQRVPGHVMPRPAVAPAGKDLLRSVLWWVLGCALGALVVMSAARVLQRHAAVAPVSDPAPQVVLTSLPPTAPPASTARPLFQTVAPFLQPQAAAIASTMTETTTTVTTTTTTTFPRPVCPADAARLAGRAEGTPGSPAPKLELKQPGCYDLRILKAGKVVGCAAPVGLFPGNKKYGCSGEFGTAATCDAAPHPVKHTQYVWVVHDKCATMLGQGTYGYAYDDGVGLKQCAPMTKYDWVLCPDGQESRPTWSALPGSVKDTVQRFRVTNKCAQPVWIDQAGDPSALLPHEQKTIKLESRTYYTYSIPNRGLASTRFLPKTGCDAAGNNCDVQSMPPCPPQGCDAPVDTKFEASWGCQYAVGKPAVDKLHCALTGQGQPSTYQDWWDGSAVDGYTLPFSVLVDDGGHGLTAGSFGSPSICGDVVCAHLDTVHCPTDEFLTP